LKDEAIIMTDEWTCGKGLAAHSTLPTSMGGMLSALAEMLDSHTRALDLTDEAGRAEYAAYSSLVAQQRMIAAALQAMDLETVMHACEQNGVEILGPPLGLDQE
jgi:hypothetical protein